MELARSLPLARNLYKSDNVKKNEIYIIKNFKLKIVLKDFIGGSFNKIYSKFFLDFPVFHAFH